MRKKQENSPMAATLLNKQLHNLYQPYLDLIYSQSWPAGVSAPLLMNVFEEYEYMALRVLVVGQETHGWGRMDEMASVQTLQTRYSQFNLGKSADYGDGKHHRYLRSPFWNFSRSLFYSLNHRDPAVSKKTNGFLWTNVSKFDSQTTTPSFALQQQNAAGFELLKQEIAIVRPDVVVFLTGTKYDHWLDHLYKHTRVPLLDDKGVLSQLESDTYLLPALTFQTQHPRTLSMQKHYHAVLAKMTELIDVGYR